MPPSARAKALAADGLRSSQSTHEIRPRRQAHGAGTARTAWSPSYAASRSPGLYSSGSEAELRIASHRLRLAALQERHGADNSATLLLVERSRPRLPTPRMRPRWRLWHHADRPDPGPPAPLKLEMPRDVDVQSSLMTPGECAAAHMKRPNAILQDDDFVHTLTMCEKERHASVGILRSSTEWRRRWLEQQDQPLPPPSYREYTSPERLMDFRPGVATPKATASVAAVPDIRAPSGLAPGSESEEASHRVNENPHTLPPTHVCDVDVAIAAELAPRAIAAGYQWYG